MERMADRRDRIRGPLSSQRRRYARVVVPGDVYYESDRRALFCEKSELSLRGLFLPCRAFDQPGADGVVRIDAGPGALLKCRVEVIRSADPSRPGMALRYVEMDDSLLGRIGKLLLGAGGVRAIPQLERRFDLIAQLPERFLRLAA